MSSPIEIVQTLSDWFGLNRSAGLKLPDGWFGRPFDNLHELTWVAARRHKLLIELDDQLLVVLTDPSDVLVRPDGISINGAIQVTFDWQGYGSLNAHARIYEGGGPVEFVVPPGRRPPPFN